MRQPKKPLLMREHPLSPRRFAAIERGMVSKGILTAGGRLNIDPDFFSRYRAEQRRLEQAVAHLRMNF